MKFRISDYISRISDFRSQVSDFRFQVSEFRFQISGFRSEVSDFRCQTSESHFGDLGPGEPLGGHRGNPAGPPTVPAFKLLYKNPLDKSS